MSLLQVLSSTWRTRADQVVLLNRQLSHYGIEAVPQPASERMLNTRRDIWSGIEKKAVPQGLGKEENRDCWVFGSFGYCCVHVLKLQCFFQIPANISWQKSSKKEAKTNT